MISLGGAQSAFPQKANRGAKPQKPATPPAPSLYNRNLIVNGDAELGELGRENAKGWTPRDGFEIETYGHTSGEWDRDVQGAPNGGKNYFRKAIGAGVESAAMLQRIDIFPIAQAVDSGAVAFTISGYFGGMMNSEGTTLMTVLFRNVSGQALASISTAAVAGTEKPQPPIGAASLAPRSESAMVPSATRTIEVQLIGKMLNYEECSNCETTVFADNLSLVLKEIKTKAN